MPFESANNAAYKIDVGAATAGSDAPLNLNFRDVNMIANLSHLLHATASAVPGTKQSDDKNAADAVSIVARFIC
jgi:hypothetical protein